MSHHLCLNRVSEKHCSLGIVIYSLLVGVNDYAKCLWEKSILSMVHWQPKATLSIPFHQPTGLQRGAWWFLVNRLYYAQFVWYFPAIWGCGWHDRTAKKCDSVPLSCSGCACLHKNLHSLDFFSFSDHAIHDSTATHFCTSDFATKKNKTLLLIDLIGIFYQFHHVPSHVPRLCPHAESSSNVPVVHLPQQYQREKLIVSVILNSAS